MNSNGRFKKKKVYFSQVSNEAIRDETLTLKAKGLYCLIQSYITIENFILYKSFLKKKCKEGQKAFENAWKELKDRGYLIQERYKDEKGKFCYVYELCDTSAHTPQKEGMDYVGMENGGCISNTDYNNTDYNNTYINKNLHHLSDDVFAQPVKQYIDCYIDIRAQHINKNHKRISDKNVDYINEVIKTLINNDIDIEQFAEAVKDYFNNLNTNKNDGDIICFLKAAQVRYFDMSYNEVVEL